MGPLPPLSFTSCSIVWADIGASDEPPNLFKFCSSLGDRKIPTFFLTTRLSIWVKLATPLFLTIHEWAICYDGCSCFFFCIKS